MLLLCLTSSSEAARVRQEYESSSAKLSKIQSRISTLSKKLNHDFGEYYCYSPWTYLFLVIFLSAHDLKTNFYCYRAR